MSYLLIALLVFVTNVIPVFMPATWTVLSYVAVVYKLPILPLALIGAVAASSGRALLAKFSQTVIRQNILSEKTRQNIDVIREKLEGKKTFTVGVVLLYAFSPFPSSQLFIAYGLTKMKLRYIVVPFFFGRLVSYSFFAFSAEKIVGKIFPFSAKHLFSGYFVLAQIFTLATIYIFTKIDWKRLLKSKR